MEESKWYVVKTNSRAEKKVAEGLTQIGIENFLPLQKRLKKWKDRKAWVEEPLIKGYVFVKTTEKLRHKTFEVGGITRFLFVGGILAKITDKEIEYLKIFCTLDDVKIEKNNFIKGDAIEIMTGDLVGLRGDLIETLKGKRIKVYISVLNCYAILNVNTSEIRKVA
jgi:transcriptional antiterminator RfaH